MTIKNNSAVTEKSNSILTEFHKWLTVVGFPILIGLLIENNKKLDEMNLLLNRHDVKIENTIQVDDAQNKRLDKFDDRFSTLDQEAYKLSFVQRHSR